MINNLSPAAALLVLSFLIIVAALWFVLPFAIFGIKNRLDRLIKLQIKTNQLLKQTKENNE